MKKKCAIYLRVSTDLQDYQRQKEDLQNYATSYSLYFDDDSIYEDKLSGFKKTQERDGLERLLKNVIKERIEFVLVWEISRLSRNQAELLKIKEIFKENSINVYFYQQKFWLLDENTKKVNPFADLLISMFGWNAEYEARLTKERFHSAKKDNVRQGKYNGGKITFGFTINKYGKTGNDVDKKFIINKKIIDGLKVSESDIVKEVFDLYENGHTCSKIALYCKSKNYPKMVCSPHTVAKLLRNTSYIGYKDVKLGKRPTPQIIDEAQFETVNELMNQNKTKADKGRKHTYLLRGVLKCSNCGNYYIGKQTDDAYMCPLNSPTNKISKGSSCKSGNISISNIDGIIWERVKDIWAEKKLEGINYFESTNMKEMVNFQNEKKGYEEFLKNVNKERLKVNRIYKQDGYTDDEYDKELNDIKKKRDDYEIKIKNLATKIREFKKSLENANKIINRRNKVDSIDNRKEMQLLIKGLVKDIVFYKVSLFKTIISIKYQGGKTESILFNSVSKKGNTFKLFNSKCLRIKNNENKFFFLKKEYHSLFDSNLSLQDKAKQKLKLSHFDFPNEDNSDVYDFDSLMKISDIPNIIETISYSKMTYFKELNTARFSRKR